MRLMEKLAGNTELVDMVSFIENRASEFNARLDQLIEMASCLSSEFDTDFALKMAKKFHLDTSKKYRQLSLGMQTMFNTLLSLASNRRVIILDEPLLRLDAIMRNKFYNLLNDSFANCPRTILISIVYHFFNHHSNPLALILYILILPLYFSNVTAIVHVNVDRRDFEIELALQKELTSKREPDGTHPLTSIEEILINVDHVDVPGRQLPFHAVASPECVAQAVLLKAALQRHSSSFVRFLVYPITAFRLPTFVSATFASVWSIYHKTSLLSKVRYAITFSSAANGLLKPKHILRMSLFCKPF